ncbi:MAG: hypothetical protein N2C12_11445 [Planctomycetales bacterium]
MEDPSNINPFEAPDYVGEVGRPSAEFNPLPCPRCHGTDITPAPYDGWYGRRAPKAIQDVVCQSCRCSFNGETGIEYPPRKNPIVWFLIALGLFLLYILSQVLLVSFG